MIKKSPMSRKMTPQQKYESLKRQTEAAGMVVREVDGQIVVSRKKPVKQQ